MKRTYAFLVCAVVLFGCDEGGGHQDSVDDYTCDTSYGIECTNTTIWWEASTRQECAESQRSLVYPQLPYENWAISRFQSQPGYRPSKFTFAVMANLFPIESAELLWFVDSAKPSGAPSQGFQNVELPTIWGPGVVEVDIPYVDVRTTDQEEFLYIAINTTAPNGQRFGAEGCSDATEPDSSWIGERTDYGMRLDRIVDLPGQWLSSGAYDWTTKVGGKFPWHELPTEAR